MIIQTWTYTIVSVVIVSLLGLIGILSLAVNDRLFRKAILYLVSFSTGGLFGDAFIHIMPEISKKYGFGVQAALLVLAGIIMFFVLEKFINWRHCHVQTSENHPHPVAYTNLIGDAMHNFIDGTIIAGSFMADTKLGVATTLAVILHEIPHEIGNFSILVHAGFSKLKAVFYNFFSALMAVVGAVAVLLIGAYLGDLPSILLPLTAGGFIYIAGSDLIPELHKDICEPVSTSAIQLFSMLAGIGLMLLLLLLD